LSTSIEYLCHPPVAFDYDIDQAAWMEFERTKDKAISGNQWSISHLKNDDYSAVRKLHYTIFRLLGIFNNYRPVPIIVKNSHDADNKKDAKKI
jgi:hypothetical protein